MGYRLTRSSKCSARLLGVYHVWLQLLLCTCWHGETLRALRCTRRPFFSKWSHGVRGVGMWKLRGLGPPIGPVLARVRQLFCLYRLAQTSVQRGFLELITFSSSCHYAPV